MKSILFTAAILFAGTAAAQSTTYQTTPTTTSPNTVMATGHVAAPGNTDPERDARGIPVISDPAEVPAGFNNPAGMGGPLVDASQPPAPQPATENYPPCTREVTDNCVQTYERGRRPN